MDTQCVSCCARETRRPRPCTTSSMSPSSRGLSMQSRCGLKMCSSADRARLDSLLRCSKWLAYCSDNQPAVADLFSTADDELFRSVTSNSNHVLHPYYLPGDTDIPYQLRTRSHRMTLINKTKHLNDVVFSKRQRITLSLLIAVAIPSVVCRLTVCLSVCLWRWCALLSRLKFSAIFFTIR